MDIGQIKCYDIFDGARLQSIETELEVGSEFGRSRSENGVTSLLDCEGLQQLTVIAVGFCKEWQMASPQLAQGLSTNLIYGNGMRAISGKRSNCKSLITTFAWMQCLTVCCH